MNPLFLGIDLGTSSIKFAVHDQNELQIYESSIKYDYETLNENWTEINPEKWFKLILHELKKIFQYPWAKEIVAMAMTGQMHTAVFVDSKGGSVRNAIMWNDKRTHNQVRRVKESLTRYDDTKLNSRIAATGSPLVNLLWLKEKEPDNYKRIHKFMMVKDYINFKLTGNIVTDYCDASTSSLYDFNTSTWSQKIMELFNFDEKIFPQIKHSAYRVGLITTDIKKILDIEHDIEIYVGTGDNAATYYASKDTSENDLLISLGTSGVALMPGKNNQISNVGKNIVFSLLPGQQDIVIQGSISTGGKALDWWIEDILNNTDYEQEQNYITYDSIRSSEELFIPYLTGEKYILNNNQFRGTFLNISPNTTRDRMTLSVMEGVAFALKNLSDEINLDSYHNIKIIGGGAKSSLWRSIFANVFNRKIKNYSHNANAVVGAIKIAKAGFYQDQVQIEERKLEETHYDSELVQIYAKKYKSYLAAVKYLNDYYNYDFEDKSMSS